MLPRAYDLVINNKTLLHVDHRSNPQRPTSTHVVVFRKNHTRRRTNTPSAGPVQTNGPVGMGFGLFLWLHWAARTRQ